MTDVPEPDGDDSVPPPMPPGGWPVPDPEPIEDFNEGVGHSDQPLTDD